MVMVVQSRDDGELSQGSQQVVAAEIGRSGSNLQYILEVELTRFGLDVGGNGKNRLNMLQDVGLCKQVEAVPFTKMVRNEIPVRLPSGDVSQAIGCVILEFREEVSVAIWSHQLLDVFKAMRMYEITQRVKVDGEGKRGVSVLMPEEYQQQVNQRRMSQKRRL